MELYEPKAKKRVRPQQQQPLPLIYNEKGELMIFTCHLNPQGTHIINPEEMDIVNSMGFFGKGSLSRNYPSFGKFYYGVPPLIRNRQLKRRQEWFDDVKKFSNEYLMEQAMEKSCNSNLNNIKLNCKSGDNSNESEDIVANTSKSSCQFYDKSHESNGINNHDQNKDSSLEICEIKDSSEEDICEIINKESENEHIKDNTSEILDDNMEIMYYYNNKEQINLQGKVILLPDSDSDTDDYLKKVNPTIKNEEFPVRETLQLNFEESFFLMYALGCLQIMDSDGKFITIKDAWDYFCKESKNFIPRYIVYHYFRSKGWVVKPGLKYGGDFLLYKDGPAFSHASYIVIVDNSETSEKLIYKKQWKHIFCLQRLSESASKEILFAQVMWPDSLTNDSVTPDNLSLFTVKEVLLRRWIPSKNKSHSDDEYDDCL